jgi:hypothetical protein
VCRFTSGNGHQWRCRQQSLPCQLIMRLHKKNLFAVARVSLAEMLARCKREMGSGIRPLTTAAVRADPVRPQEGFVQGRWSAAVFRGSEDGPRAAGGLAAWPGGRGLPRSVRATETRRADANRPSASNGAVRQPPPCGCCPERGLGGYRASGGRSRQPPTGAVPPPWTGSTAPLGRVKTRSGGEKAAGGTP